MDIVVYMLFAFSAFLFFVLILTSLTLSRQSVHERLNNISDVDADKEDEMQRPFLERIIKPVYEGLLALVTRLTPRGITSSYETLIIRADLVQKISPFRLLLNQILLAAVFAGLRILLYMFMEKPVALIQIVILAGIGFILPWFAVKRQADTRSSKIRSSLPDFLDMLYVSVEAGLSFDAAMKKTAEKMSGPLSQEALRAISEIGKGKDRNEALRGISERTEVKEVNSFITAIIQSEALGANIANTLRIQSNSMRESRRQWAQAKAARMPLKMLFPMIFLMLPALFVVILGPSLMSIMGIFG